MMLSTGRSRKISVVPIIQSFAQLDKNYGKEGAEIIIDNCQDTIFGGFAPNSETAITLSKALGNQTVMSGSISRNKKEPSQSLQMMERPLLTPDELKALPKGTFVVTKTGAHPMKTKLKLFLKWGITFDREYTVKENISRKVEYASKIELDNRIIATYSIDKFSHQKEIPPQQKESSRVKEENTSEKDNSRTNNTSTNEKNKLSGEEIQNKIDGNLEFTKDTLNITFTDTNIKGEGNEFI